MKQLILIVIIFFGSFSAGLAQKPDNDDKHEKIQALKIAFITQKLELTTDEAQKFWPLFNRYEVDLKQVWQDNRQGTDELAKEEQILNVKKKYRAEFNKIIGPPKTTILFNSEKEFRGVLMRQLKGKHGGKPS